MKGWDTGMPVCEIGAPPAIPGTHAHDTRPLPCSNCAEFACGFHGDRSAEDDEWLCCHCYEAEQERLARSTSQAGIAPREPTTGTVVRDA